MKPRTVLQSVAWRQRNPALMKHAEDRARSVQNRVADQITAFAGSMSFVYLHIIWFGCWIGLGIEGFPYGLLTMIVSLEAIFLSTFVLISQNRADAGRRILADQEWQIVQHENEQNEERLTLANQILELAQTIQLNTSAEARSRALGSEDARTQRSI